MRSSPNLTIVNFVLLGYLLVLMNMHYISRVYHFPNLIVILIYFVILALAYKAKEYLFFVFTSFLFLTLFFSFLTFNHISPQTIWDTWFLHKRALKLYSYLLLPCLFMTYTLNFYLLSEELGRIGRKGLLRFFIPILIKRELIQHRYHNIMDALWIKGYNSKSTFSKLRLLPAWIVPLIVTTLMEGAESYEYNQMLQTKITLYKPSQKTHYFSIYQKIATTILITCLGVFIIVQNV